jgi:hypothetical protein
MLIIDALFTVQNGKVGYPSVFIAETEGGDIPAPTVRQGVAWPGYIVTVYDIPPASMLEMERAAQKAYDDFIKEKNNGSDSTGP